MFCPKNVLANLWTRRKITNNALVAFGQEQNRESQLKQIMAGGLTRKFDYEKGKRKASVQKEDYRERILEEGDDFDRGGKKADITLSSVYFNLKPFYADDKRSLLGTLESQWFFVIDGESGRINQLLKNPKVSARVAELFEIMKRSVLSANEIIAVVEHPNTKRRFNLVEFRCNIRPQGPFPNLIFKKHLAFRPKLVGPALTDKT
jgi:hypothetical protein